MLAEGDAQPRTFRSMGIGHGGGPAYAPWDPAELYRTAIARASGAHRRRGGDSILRCAEWAHSVMYAPYIMKRTQIYIDDDQDAKLGRRASASGVTKSALIREAIDTYLESPADEGQRLARFRSALAEVAGSPLEIPDGRTYVEDLRAGDLRRQAELDRRRG